MGEMDCDQINAKIQGFQFQHDRLADYANQIGKLMTLLKDQIARLEIERSQIHAEKVEAFCKSASAQ